MVLMNSPSNPTGVVYTHTELKEISEVLMKYDHVNILSDDIYEHIIYGEKIFIISLILNQNYIVEHLS